MNLTLASFLVEDGCRAVKVEYDPDLSKNNNPYLHFKTLDPSIKKDDLVVVPTNTRHKFTVVKVVEIDYTVNYDGNENYQWLLGKVDTSAYDTLLSADKEVIAKVGKIEENKKKRELMAAMGLDPTTVPTYENVALASPSQPQRAAPTKPGGNFHAPADEYLKPADVPFREAPKDDDFPF